MPMKKALITGLTGQDGYYLSKLLIEKGYHVYGIIRRKARYYMPTFDFTKDIWVYNGDVTDTRFMENVIRKEQFDEIYHLAAQSFVGYSFDNPENTYDTNINGTLNVLNAVKDTSPQTKVYFAGTSEQFGASFEPLNEHSYMKPSSPYAISKLAGYWSSVLYREAYGLFITCGLLFNHESEMRGHEFVTRKITRGIARLFKEIRNGEKLTPLVLGNMDAMRDWGYAPDYVEAMYMMMQYDKPEDWVVATGETHSVREFVDLALEYANINVKWSNNTAYYEGRPIIRSSQDMMRPKDVSVLIGDSSKIRNTLGWRPKVSFAELVAIMMENDMKIILDQ